MLHISEEQVRAALPMTEAVELVEEAFRRLADGRMINHPRRRIRLAAGSFLHAMEAGDNVSMTFAAKMYVTGRAGARFVVTLFDAERSALLAVIDADALGQIRTGAASGVATKHLARRDADDLGLIGSGWQAESQLEAVAAVRTLSRVRVYSRTAEKREAFAAKMSARLGLDIIAVGGAREAIEGASIVTTVTGAREPVLEGAWLDAGCHVNAAGSNHAKRREIDAVAVRRAGLVAVDSLEQARIEAGDLIQTAHEGLFDWDRAKELAPIVAGVAPGRTSDEQITLFESQGLAAEDLIVAEAVWRKLAPDAARPQT